MRHVPPGLFLLILSGLPLPAGSGARAADPVPADPQHHAAPAVHPGASDVARTGAHPASPGPAHVAPAHPIAAHPAPTPVHAGPAAAQASHPSAQGSVPAHPGSSHPGPVHAGSAHPGSGHQGPAHPGSGKPAPAHPAPAPVPVVEPTPLPAAPDKGSNTGLPLPRWSALRTEEVNLRTGPGTRYPIDWVYKRRDLPVKVEREFDVWRLVALPDGTKGWVSGATLVTHRTFSVVGTTAAPERAMRAAASEDAAVVARLKPGVIGRIRACDGGAAWCQVQVGEYRGWLRRDAFWGTDPGEAVQ